jgi:hypothetical protein
MILKELCGIAMLAEHEAENYWILLTSKNSIIEELDGSHWIS